MKGQIIIQKALRERYPDINILITSEGHLEFDCNDVIKELEITNFASGVACGVAESFKYMKNESNKS